MGKEIDRAELAAKIQAIKEIDNETRTSLLSLINGQKKYGLVWEEHTEEVEEGLREKVPVLIEDKELFISSKDKDAPNHVLIEGDNLHALTALTYTHAGKIDVIYIDPPYNTGNKDFVYNDTFVGDDDAYRHSKWLSFMSKRLKIAKQLLSDKGVIFISIDDNEYADLKLLCDSSNLFGERNYIATFKWNRTNKAPALSHSIRTKYEYVLAYKGNSNSVSLYGKSSYNTMAPLYNISNTKHILTFPPKSIDCNFPNGCYEKGKYGKGDKEVELINDLLVEDGVNANTISILAKFKWVQDTLDIRINNGARFAFKKPNFTTMYYYIDNDGTKFIPPSDLISENECGVATNIDASERLKEMNIKFDYPKPVSLVQYLICMTSFANKKSTILDFFAGSGTTLHATMKLNEEDGGHRQCILVTNNENNICRDITYERNKRVIQGYTNSKGVNIPGLTANKLRYYHTDFVERQSSVTAKKQLMAAATDMLCIKNDIYTECEQFNGKKYRKTDVRFFAEGDNQMLIIYNIDIIEKIVAEISNMAVTKPIVVYAFSTNDYAYDADFADVMDKVTLCALPEAIYRAYLQVLPKRKLL